jgi:hypothetical protein
MAIRFERRAHPHTGAPIYTAFIKKQRRDWRERPFEANEAVRAIAEGGGWRIDKAGWVGAWLPWEAIDQTVYPTAAAAKRAIEAYASAPASGAMRRGRRGSRPGRSRPRSSRRR